MIAHKALEMTDMDALHETLEKLRGERGLSVPEIARRLKLAKSHVYGKSSIYGWFNGGGCPRLDDAVLLAAILETTVGEMIGETKGGAGLTEDERDVLKLFHALDIDGAEGMRRLSGDPPRRRRRDGKGRSRPSGK